MSLIADIKTYIVSENKFVINALKSHHQSNGISGGKLGWGEGKLRKRETHTTLVWKGEREAQGTSEILWPRALPRFARIYVNI